MKGKLQFQFSGDLQAKRKERNLVMPFIGLWQLLKCTYKAANQQPDKILIFFDK